MLKKHSDIIAAVDKIRDLLDEARERNGQTLDVTDIKKAISEARKQGRDVPQFQSDRSFGIMLNHYCENT